MESNQTFKMVLSVVYINCVINCSPVFDFKCFTMDIKECLTKRPDLFSICKFCFFITCYIHFRTLQMYFFIIGVTLGFKGREVHAKYIERYTTA